jgi:high-affinity nickel-transport protein
MNIELANVILISFIMGLRHGLDPDHLAIIDSVSMQQAGKMNTQWNGLMFSIGHGLTLTVVGVLIAYMAHTDWLPASFIRFTEWLPIGLLLFTAVYNIYYLTTIDSHQNLSSWKLVLIKKLKTGSLVRMLIIGILFALVFDTTTQTAAWTLTVGKDSKVLVALVIGIVFTVGMAITDTTNSFFFAKSYSQITQNKQQRILQKALGWVVVFVTLMLGLHQLLDKLALQLPFSDTFIKLLGVCLMLFTLIIRFFSTQIISKWLS